MIVIHERTLGLLYWGGLTASVIFAPWCGAFFVWLAGGLQ